MRTSGESAAGWFPVARADEVGTTPLPVSAGGRAWVVVRLRHGGEVSAFPARCPHRLVPLATAAVVDGRLQCAAHGWRFDGEGRCAEIPSLGAGGTPPPRADLAGPWAVEERAGWVWLAPDRTAHRAPARPGGVPAVEPRREPPAPVGPVFGNLDPSLEHAWHPVALSTELRDGGWLQVRLLGRTWTLSRRADRLAAEPPAAGVRERLGLLWLAPAEPHDVPLEVPEAGDRSFVAGWLPPLRSPGPAGPLADTFLDATHGPFVHPSTLAALPETGPYELVREPGGFRSVQEQEVDNPVDPGVATGERPLRQRRRTTYVHRAPFQLRLRQEFLDSGATTTLLYLLQPEDADSTRIYVRLMLAAGPGQRLPAPATVVEQVALQQQVLEEDIRSQAALLLPGLPLDPRDEVHVPADARGVALRQALCDFLVAGRRGRLAA
ncbi:Rieske 2Fe-2S domain-containing protein [Blastococcus sp. TML/M2B]|uniref:Rieske 2Fe-2S domain-containing protein n=1 Tax=unclassified Blastococcus TaxID=2619396 RepID=UPI00190A3B3D|nr:MULTISPECIES: Rieske 2Fe-2S domain-containing protein [unclassified Blastococcus]MBN1091141.1 Rieske 2Fe-2S domain-containing protein [Blastococcus sp. TML/M2B]MBN1095307.1 Rieske 2Fe-2S domain-containing protein [Blastococcus sp. TML/C7B]